MDTTKEPCDAALRTRLFSFQRSQALVSLAEVEKRHVLLVLEVCGGNRTTAAEVLSISIRTLQRKLKRWGLQENHANRSGASSPMERHV